MPRAPLLTIADHFGDIWDVFAIRNTAHNFAIYPNGDARSDELAALIEEQSREQAEESRRHDRS